MKPEVHISCPHCSKPIEKKDMEYAYLLPNNGSYSFFHRECYLIIDRAKQARYIADHEERRKRHGTE